MLRSSLFIIAVLFLTACGTGSKKRPDTAMDTGRDFIRASLDGDFKTAESLVLPDSQNIQYFASYKAFYQRLPKDKRDHYKSASYQVNRYVDLNDSTTIINYANDYMKKPMDIKVVRYQNQWWVDFKYAYSEDHPNE